MRNSENRSLARSALDLLLGQATTTVLAIILTGTLGRSLGPSDFGTWYLLSTITAFAYVFVDWGYGPYVIREVARKPERAGELTGTLLAVKSAAAGLVCVPAFLVTRALGHAPNTQAFVTLMIAATLPSFLITSYAWVFRGRERMDYEAFVNVALKLAMLTFTAGLLAVGARVPGVIVAQGAAGILALAVAVHLYRRLERASLRPNLATARELIREGAPIFTMSLAISLQPYFDANMLSRLTAPAVLGWYGAAAAFSGTLIAPAVILGGTVYPRLSQLVGDPNEFTRLFREGLRLILFVSVLGAVGTYLFADVAITVVYHKAAYAPAVVILRAYAPALLLISIDIFLGLTILAIGKVALLARAKLLAVAVTTLLEFALIRICQERLGNGGVGVMLSFTAGEFLLIVAILRLIPRDTLSSGAMFDFARAGIAGLATLALMISWGRHSPFIDIPITIAAYTTLSLVSGLVRPADTNRLKALVFRKSIGIARASAAIAR